MFNEVTYVHMPEHSEIMVDIDTETKKAIDVYAYVSDIKDLPGIMQKVFVVKGKNSLFIHANDNEKAYDLVKRHCIRIEIED